MRVLVAASGTGGHLFPARYIIELLEERGADVMFVGSGRPLEEKIIAPTGVKTSVLKTAGIKNRGLRGILEFLILLPLGLWQTWKIFRSFKPEAVVGVGGYVTFLPVLVAFFKRVPRWIHEAELKPGLANSVLSYIANNASTAFPETKLPGFAKVIHTGHPVRKELLELGEKFEMTGSPKRLLVMGGSQGARALDMAMKALIPLFNEFELEIWHQCREENLSVLVSAYQSAEVKAKVVPFIEELSDAYAWCDLIISRAGAGAVSEIAVVRKPTVFVPYPYAQGDHQTANAKTLEVRKQALIVQEGEGFEERLEKELKRLLDGNVYRETLAGIESGEVSNATEKIVDGVLSQIAA